MTTPTPDLAELRRLLDCSSKLPWECYRPHFASGYHSITASDGQTVAVEAGEYDAELIAAAINALPILLDAAAERDALAAKVERVRALPAKHPAGGWYVTSMRDVLAALDEEPQP